MKRNLIFTVFVLLSVMSSAHAVSVSISPAVINTVDTGSSFKADIVVENAADLAGFQFEVVYSSDIVSVSSVIFGSFPETPGRSVVQIAGMPGYEIDNDAGRLSCNRITAGSGAGASGSGVLATVTFHVKSLSDDFLNIESAYLTDTKGTAQLPDTESAEIRPRYHISTSVTTEGGTISPSGDMLVKEGESRSFDILPSVCYHISDVIADGVSVGAKNLHSFTDVRKNHTIQASFGINSFLIRADAGTGGKIYPSGNVSVQCGQSAAFTITPYEGYRIRNVNINGSSQIEISGSEYTLRHITSDHAIHADFYLMGDIDGNDAADLGDAIETLQVLAGLNLSDVPVNADVNGDGRIGIEEAVYILQKAAGLR